MKIKTVDGSYREIEETFTYQTWVAWSDIKTIISEWQDELARYQDKVSTLQEALDNTSVALGNSQVGCSDYGLMGNAMLEDED